MYYIYEIKNEINGKTYIGQHKTNNVADSYMGSGLELNLAYKKYGKENFTKRIIAIAGTKENINVLEKVFIALYRSEGKAEYNIADGGDGGNLGEEVNKKLRGKNNPFYGKHHTKETIEKNRQAHIGKIPNEIARINMSKSQKGRKHTEETKKKIGEKHKGKIVSKETREKISKSNKGQNTGNVPWNKGLKYDEGTRKNMCGHPSWCKGKHGIFSEETLEKMRKHARLRCGEKGSFYGKHHTEETKKKIGEKHKGKIPWNKGKTGFVMSQEQKEKIRETSKGIFWWNNGVVEVKSKNCPDGFVRGRIRKNI